MSASATAAMGNAAPTGYARPQRRVQRGTAFHRLTAFLLADSHQDYVVHSLLRNVLRALIVFAVVGAVIGLTVAKYATDNDLRGATTTVREEDVSKLSGARIELAQCPCQNDTLLWSAFVTTNELLTNITSVSTLCQDAVVPELKTARGTTAESTPQEVQAYNGYIDKLQANFVPYVGCILSVFQVGLVLNPAQNVVGLSDTSFYNTELLSQRQLDQRVGLFVANNLLAHQDAFGAQLTLQRFFLQQLYSNYSTTINEFIDTNTTAGANAAEATKRAVELAQNITQDASSAMAAQAINQEYINGVLEPVSGALTANYTMYKEACMPYYCDYTKGKSTWSRITEFLGLLGGLYTTLIGVGFLAWFLVDLALPGDHGNYMV